MNLGLFLDGFYPTIIIDFHSLVREEFSELLSANLERVKVCPYLTTDLWIKVIDEIDRS